MDKVDATMAAVNEQRELANEIADTIATPLYTTEIDDVCSSRAYSSSTITEFFCQGGAEAGTGGSRTRRTE
jgi:hypothetical protein